MTDNEKKAISLLQISHDIQAARATLNSETVDALLSLINRQKTEIEKVKPIHNSFERELECAKQEAIKEFAERIKTIIEKHYLIRGFDCVIDTLVQEMVGDEDG